MKNIVIFASGSGSNAENIIQYFSKNPNIAIQSVFCNKSTAGVITRAEKLNIPTYVFNKQMLNDSSVLTKLKELNTDFIVLAGFLLKMTPDVINQFPNKIINIHPALLPKYGGKGMYGMYVHEAVVKNNEKESGITIHYVNENYDEGAVIFQKSFEVIESDTAESVAKKIYALEQAHFPVVIHNLLK